MHLFPCLLPADHTLTAAAAFLYLRLRCSTVTFSYSSPGLLPHSSWYLEVSDGFVANLVLYHLLLVSLFLAHTFETIPSTKISVIPFNVPGPN